MIKENNTFMEIMNQAQTLELVYEDVLKNTFDMSFLEKQYDEILFFGCGTDYNLCQSASFFTNTLISNCPSYALPSSELLINTEAYIKEGKKYLVIGFSRSGLTTESIETVKKLNSNNNITVYIFSAVKNSEIIKLSKQHFICRDSVEKSIAMTKAYTSFLFAYCIILAKFAGRKDMLDDFEKLINYLKNNIGSLFKNIKDYLQDKQFNTFFALGSGFDYGMAVEADLKMKEMSHTNAYSYHLHEFNHGPKTLVSDKSLVLIMALNKNLYNLEKVVDDIARLGPEVLIVSGNDLFKQDSGNIYFLTDNLDFKFSLVKSFINIPVFQMLAYVQATKKNLNPDKPRNLNYTTLI